MADKRFFTVAGPFFIGELAEMTGSELSDPSAAEKVVDDVAPLQSARENHLTFLDNRKYLDYFRATKAGACFVKPELAAEAPEGTVVLTNKNPYKAYAIAAQAFYPTKVREEFRAPSAVIDPSAVIGPNCHIDHGVVIGKNVKIGANCRIQPQAVIREGVEIGDDSDIGPNVYISHSLIGKKAKIHPGAVIGRQGFGFAIDPGGYIPVPQLGRVILEDDVEIGANSTVDRGSGPDTVIGRGTRIDNLVQIGHNVKIGKFCVIVSQTGISGSTQLGDYVMTGGQSGFAGHLQIGSGAKIAAQSGIMRDVPAQEEVMGSPAVPIRQFMRQTAIVSRMATTKKGNEE
ncbi:MAG TPA: UDP-3-O-(3-hydroxymyristoyl)glucosamine N-acyltransferase [Patescibacteria group bacterium]|nr:UDP-3-O-(3-hydroxymyristoyl)glucosamine N-acyltransferase [Patescibacteria group bacterium]